MTPDPFDALLRVAHARGEVVVLVPDQGAVELVKLRAGVADPHDAVARADKIARANTALRATGGRA